MTSERGRPVERVLVLGCPGAGKTRFSREVARKSGLPLHHLDDYYWGPGWSRPDADRWISIQQALVAEPCWIVEGNYMATVPIRVRRADLIVIIEASTLTCITRVIRRVWQIRRGRREDLPAEVRRDVARRGTRPAATKDFPGLLWKILRFRTLDAVELRNLTRANARALRVLAIAPGPWGLNWVGRHITWRDDQLLVLPLREALEFVVDQVMNARRKSAPRVDHVSISARDD
jgi:hypothetical protein